MNRRLVGFILFLLFTIVFTWQVASVVKDWTLQRLHQKGSDELLSVITQLRSTLDSYHYLPFLISQDSEVKTLLQTGQGSERDAVNLYLEKINLVAGASGLFVLDARGYAQADSNWRDNNRYLLAPHNQHNYYLQAVEGQRGRQFSLNRERRNPAYYLSSPIYVDRAFEGVAVVRIKLNKLVDQLKTLGTVLISNQDGVLFFSNGSFSLFENLEEQARITSSHLSNGIRAELWSHGDERWLARKVILDDLQWEVIALSDTEVVQRNVRNAVLFAFGGCIAAGLFGLFFRERQLKLRSQNETRAALAKSEARQKAIINNAQVGLILIDETGRITFANEMALQQFSVSSQLILQKPLISLLSAEGVTPIERLISRLGERGFSPLIGYEAVGIRGDGTEFPLMISIRRMQQHTYHQYLVTLIDISRRKGLELALKSANESLEHKVKERTQALHEAQDELIQAGKMAVLGRMSTAIVHELNQPLTAIRNYVAICRQVMSQPEMLEESLVEMDMLTQRMAQITTQLKTYAYKKPEQRQPVSMQMAVEHSLQMFKQRVTEQEVDIQLLMPEHALYVEGDSARLEQVVVNLIKNSLDALDGSVMKQITIQLYEKGSIIVLEVSDSGPGIEPSLLQQLFDPFVTSKKIGAGLGLGLAIVRSILRDLGGEISAENREIGAFFRVSLPLCEDREKYNG